MAGKENEVTDFTFNCCWCDKKYQTKGGLSKHAKLKHGSSVAADNEENGSIKCSHCNSKFTTLVSLIRHENDCHNVKTSLKEMNFPSFHSFLQWKKQTELETRSQYVQRCSKQKSNSTTRYYYYCNRSGSYVSKSSGMRVNKSQGTNKLGCTCPAHIRAVEDNLSKQINVQYYDGHNHEISLGHIYIPKETRYLVAQKLKEGVTVQKVLDFIRDDVDKQFPHYTRQHIITKQDVYNIKRQFNIEGVQRHAEDQLSVCALVSEFTGSNEYNPVVIFKPQDHEDSSSLAKEDFIVGIQTKFQLDMMKLFCSGVVCMDSTHGTNCYNFKLVTVLVLDDFGEGIPVAWLISNKENATTLITFLQALLVRTGSIENKFFMSDDAEQYYTAWKTVYGGNPSKLLCTWHVDRAWRSKINSLVSNNDAKASVYFKLRTLLQELSVSQFRKMMQSFITDMLSDVSLKEFAKYFETSYTKRCEQWAYCYRIGTPVNTNMTIEAFHRLLKVVYLESKHNRRVDHLMSVLFKIARDKEFERLIKHEKGKITYRIAEINKRHRAAISIKDINIKSETTWQVPSLESTAKYTVQKIIQFCDCKIKCSECQVCMHLYNCSCVDYAIHNTACKHIHAVHTSYLQTSLCEDQSLPSNDQPSNPGNQSLTSDGQLCSSHNQPFHATSHSQPLTSNDQPLISNDQPLSSASLVSCDHAITSSQIEPFIQQSTIPRVKNEFKMLLDEAQAIVHNTDNTELLKTGLPLLRNCVSVMRSLNYSSATKRKQFSPTINIPPNTKIQHQTRFYSTKRKRVTANTTLTKPTAMEMEQCRTSFLDKSNDVYVCAVCFREQCNDQEDSIHWIQCSICSAWVHTTCVGISDLNREKYLLCFTCPYC